MRGMSSWRQFRVNRSSILIYGIGNPGRQDDGLGIAFIESIRPVAAENNWSLESNYQLNVEDAMTISAFDVVVFVDATRESNAASPFQWRRLLPKESLTFTTHAMSPETVLALSEELYGAKPKAFLLTIPGSAWEVSTELTAAAQKNLNIALAGFSKELSICMNSL